MPAPSTVAESFFFCTVEHIIDCSAVESDDIRATVVLVRRLPICALGQGRFSLADKVACLMHQMWLDYGPSANDVIRANHEVRQRRSDMGTAFDICDYPGVVSDILLGTQTGSLQAGLKTTKAATTDALPLQKKTVIVAFGFGGSWDAAYNRLGPQLLSG